MSTSAKRTVRAIRRQIKKGKASCFEVNREYWRGRAFQFRLDNELKVFLHPNRIECISLGKLSIHRKAKLDTDLDYAGNHEMFAIISALFDHCELTEEHKEFLFKCLTPAHANRLVKKLS